MCVHEVLEGGGLAEQLAVGGGGQVDVEDHVIVDGEAEHDADQRELAVRLERTAVRPEAARVLAVREHAWTDSRHARRRRAV